MSHRVSVENGKYTFVNHGAYTIDIQRGGEPWSNDLPAPRAIYALMCELDAARVVLEAARKWKESFSLDSGPRTVTTDQELMDAIAKHDRLVDDHQPPSDWTK